MVRRKPISLADKIGRMQRLILPTPPPDILGTVSTQKYLTDKINDIKAEAAKAALSKYNAADFQPIIVEQPDATYVAPIGNINKQVPKSKRYVINHSGTPVKSYTNKQREFVNDIYNSYYRNLVASGSSPNDAKRQARHLAQKSAYETGWGQSIYAKHNYGGHEVPDGKGGIRKLTFKSMDDYTKADIKLLDRKWKPWRTAKNEDEFVTAITTDYGQGRYNAVNDKYRNTYKGMSKRMNNYLSTRYGGRIERPKAWVGAVIGAASSLLGSILNSNAQEKQLEEQRRIQAHKDAVTRAENMTQALNLTQNAQKEYEDRFRLPYAKGGRRRLRDGVSITDGGPVLNLSTGGLYYAGDKVPYGKYLDLGPTHEEKNSSGKTGTGWNIAGKKIETENKEIEEISPTQMKVYSDSLELPNGMTPSEYVLNGGDKDYAFKIQQSMNGDYGRRTMRNGGHCSRPVGRIKAEDGIVIRNGRKYKKVNYPNSNKTYWQDLGSADNSEGFFSRTFKSIKNALNSRPQPTGKKPRTGYRAVNSSTQNAPYYNVSANNTVSSTPSKNMDNIEKALASKGLANTPENRRLYTLANKKGGTTQAGMNYTGTRNGGTLDEIVVTGRAPYTDLSGAVSNYKEDLSYLDKDDNRNIVRNSNNSSSTSTYSTPTRNSGRRRLRNNGRTNIGAFNVPDISNPGSAPVTSPLQLLSDDDKSRLSAMYSEAPTVDTSILSNGVTPKQSVGEGLTSIPDNTTTPNNTSTPFKRYTTSDWIGLGADIIGSLGSALINYNAAGRIAEPPAPVRLMPGKLITNYNIAPRLAQVSMLRNRGLRDTDELVSSSARLNARNRVNALANLQADQLWGEKTNREVELLNADTMNQQNINNQNVQAYNAWQDRLSELRNRRSLGQAQALQYGLSGLSDAVGNFLDQGRQNYADNQAMKYYAALLGNEGISWLRRNGVNLRNGGRMRLRNV